MDEQQLRLQLGTMRAEMEWTRMALIETLRALRPVLTPETAQGLVDRTRQDIEAMDRVTAHLPGDQDRAIRALALLAALRESLGLPPG